MNSFQDLYKNHTGKISHKWSIYLNQYEQKLKHYQNLPIKLLEVGVQKREIEKLNHKILDLEKKLKSK